ncbi:MAG: hypothetical protein ABI539_08110 [Acidobacteriota bacterium]
MKTVVLCVVFLIAGAAAGATLMAYFMNTLNKRSYAMFAASNLGLAAMQAELIKLGETALVLQSLENTIPDQVIMIHENEMVRESMTAEAALTATKRFYVCTKTPIPEKIGVVLESVALPDDACAEPE